MTARGPDGSTRGVTILTNFLSAAFFRKESGTLISKTSESASHKSFTSTDQERKGVAFKTQENQFETALVSGFRPAHQSGWGGLPPE